ncbi:uncharacterized protein EV420DRAFT_599905 [Desarmillaria tabescens]|uniref:BTB domain-containing protein n=1 Tax=Armillaria tabescens TaxID=1929756 RepID=A0AA39IZQ2_ARMTA|nr:uncharacterized protein EV420DRAFT_599905 [Desarmillaria tabescens]KAK0432824.1 hypothetical protein EV420DRAFT_599905 [Desarmillaria tabescens]
MLSHTQSVLEFYFTDADIILSAEDTNSQKRRFAVHKCILSAASPFFRDMFSLPQPPMAQITGLPTIDTTEVADVLHTLLQFIYPVPNPVLPSLGKLVPVLEAARKYDVLVALTSLRKQLISHKNITKNPLRIYAIASRYDLQDEIKVAAKYTLKKNVLDCPLSDDLKHITAYDYHRLLDFHRRYVRATQDALKPPQTAAFSGHHCSAWWWTKYEEAAKDELAARPSTDVVFSLQFVSSCVSACNLCRASAYSTLPHLELAKQKMDAIPFTL